MSSLLKLMAINNFGWKPTAAFDSIAHEKHSIPGNVIM